MGHRLALALDMTMTWGLALGLAGRLESKEYRKEISKRNGFNIIHSMNGINAIESLRKRRSLRNVNPKNKAC